MGGMIYQVGYFAYFKVNQAQIIEKYCVNKDKPEMECNGHCHLKKELNKTKVAEEQEEDGENRNRLPEIELEFLVAVMPVSDNQLKVNDGELFALIWKEEFSLCTSDKDTFWHPPQV
jgi:hypothetical protein